MENLDRVIAGLECCMDDDRDCYGCPQDCDEFGGECVRRLMLEAAEWLHSLRGEVMHLKECRSGSGDYIRLSDLMEFPIRIDHYDKVNGNEHFVYGVETVLEYAENLPKVEAEPVVHAHWNGDCCSRCGELSEENYPRCPHCGAHMDEEVADGDC